MKTIDITCVVCSSPYSYNYKGGRKRKTCDNRECVNTRGNFTRARSRKRERGEVPEYADKVRPAGLTVKTQEQIEKDSDAWREFQSNRRPQSGSSDIDCAGWEAHTDVDDDGNRVFGSDDQDEYEGVPSANGWVRKAQRATLADGFVADDYRDDSDVVREIRSQRKLVDDWYQRTPDAPPKTALNVGSTITSASGRPLDVRGSATKPEAITRPSVATLLRNFGARPDRMNNAHGTEIVVRPVPTLRPFVWDSATGARFPVQLPPRECQPLGVAFGSGTGRPMSAAVATGVLEDGRDWSRWTTTDTSTWWD